MVTVENLKNPYEKQDNFNTRFKLTLNKLYAWSLVAYDRFVMLDSDNLFLQRTDELFQCGQFCAIFINPCVFHTGLFVLQAPPLLATLACFPWCCIEEPLMEITGFYWSCSLHWRSSEACFMNWKLDEKIQMARIRASSIASYFPDLLDRPMFHPPSNGSKLEDMYRLPLGYQMDASYYYLKLRWSIPCGPNSVITFPSAPWFKPWYWWSWPVRPLGFSWHKQRRKTLGYSSELPVILIQSVLYLGVMAVFRMARPSLSKLFCKRRAEKSCTFSHTMIKVAALWSILAAYTLPSSWSLVPCTHLEAGLSTCLAHRFWLLQWSISSCCHHFMSSQLGWGSLVLCLWWRSLGILTVLWGALSLFSYAFCCAPVVWGLLMRALGSLQVLLEREAFLPKLGETTQPPQFSKLYWERLFSEANV